jgi:TrmH family RNA methyltransferase
MPEPGKTSTVPAPDIRVVLVGTSHPGNIGAAARAMRTMGLEQLVLVKPLRFPHADATARAAGADGLLTRALVVPDLASAVADCAWVVATSARPRHLRWPEVDPRGFAREALVRAASAPVAVVFGRENSGLSNDELDRCHALLRLPAVADFSSLNLAAAVQVVAYQIRLECIGAGGQSVSPAADASGEPVTQQEMEGLYAHLERVLVAIGYLDPEKPRLLPRRLRRMFNRMQPDRAELNILRGILADVEKRAR